MVHCLVIIKMWTLVHEVVTSTLKTNIFISQLRAALACALGAIVKVMTEDCYNKLMPWLLETYTLEVSSVDKSGFAQGMINSTSRAKLL